MVADQGSFRGAARELGYTQSAISHQIASLERSLGTSLFTRPGWPRRDRPDARRRQRRLPSAPGACSARCRRSPPTSHYEPSRAERNAARIGTFQTATTELLPPALRALREERPDVEVRLNEIPLHAGADLRSGSPPAARSRVPGQPEPDDRIQSIPLFDDPWVILTRRDCELPPPRSRASIFLTVPRSSPGTGAGAPRRAREGVAAAGDQSRVVYRTTTTWPCSDWWPPDMAMHSWTGWAPPVRWQPSLTSRCEPKRSCSPHRSRSAIPVTATQRRGAVR